MIYLEKFKIFFDKFKIFLEKFMIFLEKLKIFWKNSRVFWKNSRAFWKNFVILVVFAIFGSRRAFFSDIRELKQLRWRRQRERH